MLILVYICLGIIVTAFRPTLRALIKECFRQESQRFNKGLALLISCVISFVAVALWPFIWLANILRPFLIKYDLIRPSVKELFEEAARTPASHDSSACDALEPNDEIRMTNDELMTKP
jgi:hypothetical protein